MPRHRIVIALACVLSLLALASFIEQHSYSLYDDAFIYLRYVKNVRAGCGLRFNCSEGRVEGFASPMWLLFLVAGSQFTHKLVSVTQFFGAISMTVLMVATPITAAQTHGAEVSSLRRGVAAMLAGGLLALDHYALLNAVTGLETGLAAAVGVLTYAAVSAERRRLAIACAFTMFSLRPEGLLFVLALFVLPWARTRRVIAICVAGLAAITLVRWLVFHDVVPNLVWARIGGGARQWQHGASYLWAVLRDFPALLGAPLLLLWPPGRKHASYIISASLSWLVVVGYAGGDVLDHSRLAFPVVAPLTVCGVQGALAVSKPLASGDRRAGTGFFVLVLIALATRASIAHVIAPAHAFQPVVRWTKTGQHLKVRHRDRRIATVQAGAVSYFSELDVLDLSGATSPAIAHARPLLGSQPFGPGPIRYERDHLDATLAWAPDLLVTTKYRTTVWDSLDDVVVTSNADALFLRAVKEGRAPYRVADLEILPNFHVLAFARTASPP